MGHLIAGVNWLLARRSSPLLQHLHIWHNCADRIFDNNLGACMHVHNVMSMLDTCISK